MMTYGYARSEPGHPGISLHADGQPYGSNIFGYEGSCPFLVRVLYYLDDLTREASPFRVVPHSHLSMHADANPDKRYESHPEEVMVPAKAGSANLINHRVFHGNYPNTGDHAREMLAIAYRPGWPGPGAEVEEWDAAERARMPDSVRPLLGVRSKRIWDFDGGIQSVLVAARPPLTGQNVARRSPIPIAGRGDTTLTTLEISPIAFEDTSLVRLFDFGFDHNVLACKTLVTLAISRREQAIAKRQ